MSHEVVDSLQGGFLVVDLRFLSMILGLLDEPVTSIGKGQDTQFTSLPTPPREWDC